MNSPLAETVPIAEAPGRAVVVSALGVTQMFAWGASYYLPAVLAAPIAADTGWSLTLVVGGFSLGLLTAGLVSPLVGRAIARRGGRPVLAASAGLLAVGLSALALASSRPAFLIAWQFIGLGMGTGLLDPAFATLGRLYGARGRSAMTTVTLFAGFASSVCWPLAAFLDAHLGWRGACLVFAGVQSVVSLPIYLFVLPREPRQPTTPPVVKGSPTFAPLQPETRQRGLFLLLAASTTLHSVILTVFSVHLLAVLQAKGLALAAAVGLGALVGPSQVAARAVEMAVARYHHPIWTKLASASLVAAGLAVLWRGGQAMILALMLYGAGIGLESIARGTLPLAIFGPERYPLIIGRIAMASLVAQAAAPSIGTALIEAGGLDVAMTIFVAAAAVNVLLTAGLFRMLRSISSARLP